MPIRVLSDIVAAQIAAGEVVERPASVVKEVIENALDAGAESIIVEVEQGGKKLIRVSDDGFGIAAAEAALAFARHSTSKLETVADLDRIQTLGFRGEALASIASVSRTTLVTRHRDEDTGTEVLVEGGEVRYDRAAGAPVGTVVTIENLFFNTPARLKFLKADSTERRHITQLITRYAMAYPGVRFQLIQEGREQFRSTGSGDLADVLVEAYGLDTFKEMLEVDPQPLMRKDLPPIEVYGYTSAPGLNRSNRSHIVLFLNGRAIADQSLTYAVVQAYHTLMPQGRFPLAVILITVPPDEVDVNVHPTKAEVRFRYPDAVFSAVQRSVRDAVIAQSPVPPVQGDPYQRGEDYGAQRDRAQSFSAPQRPVIPGEQYMRSDVRRSGSQLELDLRSADPGRYTQQREDRRQVPPSALGGVRDDETAIPAGPGRPQRPRTLPILRVIGQVGAMYIVAEGPAGLYLVDQHAAHERILYEEFMARQAALEPVVQHTLGTTTVDFSTTGAQLVEESLELLAALGFDLEPFGTHTFRLRAIPALLADRDPVDVLHAIIEDLERGVEPGEQTLEDKLTKRVCKAAAVKAGQTLSYDEMTGIIQQLERCEYPRTCPHGRPTMLHISGEELAKQFGRE